VTLSVGAATVSRGRGPAIGVAVQFVLLGVLAATTGLSTAGVLVGAVYGLVLCGLLTVNLRRAGMRSMGPANVVTLARALMIGGVTAMVVSGYDRPVHLGVLVTLVGVALALDGVDGQVARRTGSTSALGARFDMEVDSFLVLVLSVFVAGTFGWWTIAIGAFRYAFVAASWAAPWLTAPLPPRFSRKVVAATQGVVLVTGTAHLLPYPIALTAIAAALASLVWSFGLDIVWLWRTEQVRLSLLEPARTLPIVPRSRLATRDAASVGQVIREPASVG
jgi:phosphatidylglycerophosphate synthase